MKTEALLRNKVYSWGKRCFDIVVSFVAGIVLLIPLAVLCILIMIRDFGNPFYVQIRIGMYGREFHIVKLRSMKKGSEDIEHMLNEKKLSEYYQEYKLNDDPRLIGWKKEGDGKRCFGAFIRRASLDEIPQIIWNILIKGNMAVVGPRPVLKQELETFYSPDEQAVLLSVKPGLTGYWQAHARNNATYETGERQRMELYYAQNHNIWMDIKIMFATFEAVLRKSGAK